MAQNQYFRLHDSHDATRFIGEYVPHSWHGRSQLFRQLCTDIELPEGAEVHLLQGGDFAVMPDGQVIELVRGSFVPCDVEPLTKATAASVVYRPELFCDDCKGEGRCARCGA